MESNNWKRGPDVHGNSGGAAGIHSPHGEICRHDNYYWCTPEVCSPLEAS